MSFKSVAEHIPYECDNLTKMNITNYHQFIELKQIELSSFPTEVEKNIIMSNWHNLEKMDVIDENYKFIFDFSPFIKKNNIKLELKLNTQMAKQELQVNQESITRQNINDCDTMFPKLVAYKNNICEIVLENQENKFRKGAKKR